MENIQIVPSDIHIRRMTTMTLCIEEKKGYKLTYTTVERRDPFI